MSDKLEQELRRAFERVDPPAGFAERVLARAAKEEARRSEARRPFGWFGTAGLRWAAACALCIALATSGLVYHHERVKEGEQAKEQLMLALRITSSKLQIATEGVRQIISPGQRSE
jgi:hypothetical protein